MISAIGTANPQYKRHQLETVDLVAGGLQLKKSEQRRLKSLYQATGIDYRYSVLCDYCKEYGSFDFLPNNEQQAFPSTAERMQVYKEQACPLAIAAIKDCLSCLLDFDTRSITHLITVSCTGMYAPGIDIELIQALNMNLNVQRTAINFMGCYGAFNGLKVADAICLANQEAKVLVVCVELCTIHFQKSKNMDNFIANAIFADGAAAVLVQSFAATQPGLCLEEFYCDLVPQTAQEMAWTVGNFGFDIVLSSYVPEIIEAGIASFTKNLLTKYQLTLADIEFFAIHPGGIKILKACELALNLLPEQNHFSYEVLRQYGNMSSATVLFVLKEIWNKLKKTDDQKLIFSCAFGPGLTLESMLLKINQPK
jgi:alpha-pyrone synthase